MASGGRDWNIKYNICNIGIANSNDILIWFCLNFIRKRMGE